MGFEISKSQELMVQGLNARALRQDLISSNIANIDTPFYKARDVDFETTLIAKTKELYGEDDMKVDTLAMAQKEEGHLSAVSDFDASKATVYMRDGQLARNDGNTVDLDVETSELGKNAVMFNALSAALQKNSSIFRSVIDYSAKL